VNLLYLNCNLNDSFLPDEVLLRQLIDHQLLIKPYRTPICCLPLHVFLPPFPSFFSLSLFFFLRRSGDNLFSSPPPTSPNVFFSLLRSFTNTLVTRRFYADPLPRLPGKTDFRIHVKYRFFSPQSSCTFHYRLTISLRSAPFCLSPPHSLP